MIARSLKVIAPLAVAAMTATGPAHAAPAKAAAPGTVIVAASDENLPKTDDTAESAKTPGDRSKGAAKADSGKNADKGAKGKKADKKVGKKKKEKGDTEG